MTGRLLAALTAVLLACVAAAFWLTTPPPLPDGATVVVREGDSVAAIAARLRDARVVRSALAFRVWARARGLDRHLRPGEYRFPHALPLRDLLDTLTAGAD